MNVLKLSSQQAKQKMSRGTLYYPLKNKFGNEIIPSMRNILSTVNFISLVKTNNLLSQLIFNLNFNFFQSVSKDLTKTKTQRNSIIFFIFLSNYLFKEFLQYLIPPQCQDWFETTSVVKDKNTCL